METIKKTIGEGHARGELFRALAYSATDVDSGRALKQVRFNPDSGSTAIIIGDSTTAITLATYAQRAISIYTTSASTDGSNTVLPVYINATMSATGGVGRAIEAKLTVTGKLGSWGNAIKGYTDLTGGTGSAGLVSAICAEMKMPASTALGTHAVLEIELVMPASAVIQQGIGANCTSFIRARVSDNSTAVQSFNDYGYLLDLQGLTSGSTDLFDGCTLKCAIGSTKYYLLLSTATASFTTAYPIVSTDDNAIGIISTFVPDDNYTDYALALGWKGDANEIEVSFASANNENLNLIQMNVNAVATVADEGPTNASQMNLIHSLITHDTHDMDNLRLKCADFNIVIKKDLQDAYAYQGEIDFTAASIAVGGEAAVLGLVMNAGSSAVTGNLRGIVISMEGTGMPADALGIELRSTATTLAEGIRISGTPLITVGIAMGNQANDNEGPTHAFFFPSGPGADVGPVVQSVDAGNGEGSIKIKIGSATKYLKYWTDPA